MYLYKEVLQLLESRLPMFSRVGKGAIREGLTNIILLCEALGNPHQRYPCVHIAGTNGKGSTSHLIAAALQHNGYKTGLYTSPHLVDLRERFRINGEKVSEDFVIRFMEKALPLIDSIQPSYFELNVAMAFSAFAENNVDIAVIETGLGGRLDSTNIITPILSVITNIGLDHTQILGNTLAEIAKEKAGIIKEKVPVVIGETQPETERIFLQTALAKHAPIHFADSLWELIPSGRNARQQQFRAVRGDLSEIFPLQTDLLGTFQRHNIKTAIAATGILHQAGWRLPLREVLASFSNVKEATGLRGRWDWIHNRPNIILDVAHNAAGMAYLLENIRAFELDTTGKLHIICGFVKDKDVYAALELFPKEAVYYFTQAQIPRALPAADLLHTATEKALAGESYPTVKEALSSALGKVSEKDTIIVTGSFFIVGEAMAFLDDKQVSPAAMPGGA